MRRVIDRKGVQRLVSAQNAVVIEVMGKETYDQEHIAGAISLPIREISRQRVERLDKQRATIVYCWDSQ